jgi:hypothetical protein
VVHATIKCVNHLALMHLTINRLSFATYAPSHNIDMHFLKKTSVACMTVEISLRYVRHVLANLPSTYILALKEGCTKKKCIGKTFHFEQVQC